MSRRAVLFLFLAIVPSAGAYDSQCSRPTGEGCESGPDAAQNRWLGPSAEHRLIWEHTRLLAGLPAAVAAPVALDVFTGVTVVPTGAGPVPSLAPVAFVAAANVRRRELTVGELAQLPDFSYALWDWAMGNETCPLGDGVGAVACHDFRTHMGPVNSNHFLPQARTFYAHYHALALGRATACRELAVTVGAEAARFRPFLEACEDEALMLEAVGHHFLQDAWSMGHMWERWGSPDPAAFPDRIAAIAVAMASGLIHGARGVLQEYMSSPISPYRDVPDALCAPSAGVLWRSPGMPAPALGLGDLYYPLLTDPSQPFGLQAERLFSCAAAGMREVYAAAGEQHGPMAPLDPVLRPLDPLSDDCFAQRATNRAMQTGAALELLKDDGTPERIPLDGDLATALVIAGAEGGLPSETMQERYRLDMANALFRIRVGAEVDPDGVEAASGKLPPLLGVLPNGAYVASPPAPYVDPPLPWSADDQRSLALERTFHRAHAKEWCVAMGRRELLALGTLRARAQSDLPAGEHAAALAVCAELAARHLRFGKDATDYDTAHEPLCAFVPETVQFAYTGEEGDVGPDDFAATRDAAESWCVATTTTTTTSSTTTTLPSGPRVAFTRGNTGIGLKAGGHLPDVSTPPPLEFGGDGSTSFPYDNSVSIAFVEHAVPPNSSIAAADSTGSASSALTFDAEGNLVGINGSGTCSGHATLSGTPTWRDYPGGSRADGSAVFSVWFRVSGAPVAYTFEATVSSVPEGSAGVSAMLALGREFIARTYTGDGSGHVVLSGVLAPREEEYQFGAGIQGAASVYSNRDSATEFQGEYHATLTLAPVGSE